MPITFTDEQIREITGRILEAPTAIEELRRQKEELLKTQQDFLDLDEGNAVYTDFFRNVIVQYHTELKYLNGEERTAPVTADIDPAGQLASGNVYFPESPIWTKFPPKIQDYLNGNPIGSWPDLEELPIASAQIWIDYLLNGFADGIGNTTTTSGFTGNEIELTTAALIDIGDRVILLSGVNFLLGTVTNKAGNDINVSIILSSAGYGGILTGASCRNFHPGFTLAERETASGLSAGENGYMEGLKAEIDTRISVWESRLTPQEAALTANDALAPYASDNQTALSNVQAALSDINTWQAFPSLGSGTSRFGTNLPALQTRLSTRDPQIAPRAAQIIAALGSVAQDGDGNYSGSGNYLSYIQNVNQRINKSSGTLRNYYQLELGKDVFDQRIAAAQEALARDTQVFDVKPLIATATGTGTLKIINTLGLSISIPVKICSNTKPVINATVTGFDDQTVQLDVSITADYTVDDKARLVRQI